MSIATLRSSDLSSVQWQDDVWNEPAVVIDVRRHSPRVRVRADRPAVRQSQPSRVGVPLQPTRPCGYGLEMASQPSTLPGPRVGQWRLTMRAYSVIAIAFTITVVVTAAVAIGVFLGVSNAPMP